MRKWTIGVAGALIALGTLGFTGAHPVLAGGSCTITLTVKACDETAADSLVLEGSYSEAGVPVDFQCVLTMSVQSSDVSTSSPVSTNQGGTEFSAGISCTGPVGATVSVTNHKLVVGTTTYPAPASACVCGTAESSSNAVCSCSGGTHEATISITAPFAFTVFSAVPATTGTVWNCPATPVLTFGYTCNPVQ